MKINFAKIEKKWQSKWEKSKAFEVKEGGKKEKYYVLEMYPYPSASGLHIGHAFNYTIGDIYARFKRMQGFNVLYPMGYDSFGLPAENAAIRGKSHPKKFTEDAIKNYIKQQKNLGLSYDWSRMVECHKPDFYKWDQWIFLKMFEKGLAYKKEAPVNWCSQCNTVLANEQVKDGRCYLHEDTEVEIKHLDQWFLKITKYADELYEDIEKLKDWPEDIKAMQKNWIGKSQGTDIYFKLEDSEKILSTYTTRCDTIFSVTFLAVAPESPLVNELVEGSDREKEVKEFSQRLAKESFADRINEEKEKEGIFTGRYAINPVNNEKVPIYVANFALMYGSGVVMCDAHDKRDFRFARKYDIPLKFVISEDGEELDAMREDYAFVNDGILFNSGEFSGMNNREALPKMANWIEKNKWGKKTINYKLRDWLISRQRFWGTPIPIIYCDGCGIQGVPEKDLPVKLPDNIKFTSKKNPLIGCSKFMDVKCPKCKGKARRETDTMDTFVNSSWYFLRYCDAKNEKAIFDKKKIKHLMPIDIYIGGREHATGHLIYCRFYTKFLRDIGLLDFDEPAVKLFNQGMVHGPGGEKMSKSRGNVVMPEVVSEKFGVDSVRLFLVSTGGPDKNRDWSDKGAEGILKLIEKVIDYASKWNAGKSSAKVEHKVNKGVKEITEDIENLKYNLAVIKLRGLFGSLEGEMAKKDLESFVKLFSVFCPHVGEELWSRIGGKGFVSLSDWPKCNEKKINEKFDKAEKAVERTVADILNILKIVSKGELVYVYVLPNELENYSAEEIAKRVGKDVNVFAVNDKKKYDPKNKSKKVKPGRPGIFVE
ncbi:MAG: leucine--tRNA ligase [Nanoarchaeota archaeon]|nr:leucine--tRNA ligase [Nanoarchaeota archaeon]MBU1989009.1 leucine--tRNA ligase [Nanoarchaeota archaeon]